MSSKTPLDDSMLDKQYGVGPVMFSLKLWLMFLIVVIGVFVYYSKYYHAEPVIKSSYYY
jgi:hypothetical protein